MRWCSSEQRVDTDPEQVLAALLKQLQRSGLDALPWGEASRRTLARLRFVAAQPNAGLPAFDDATLLADADGWLAPYLAGHTSLGKLPEPKLTEALQSRLTHSQRSKVDAWAPTHVTVPTGSRIAVDYEDDNAPCIEVRMQEVFGLADTPRIAGGAVPITLKLLSPARRPMQITRDLAGFWRGSYAEVRRDMRGRYPRHYWPENPAGGRTGAGLEAAAQLIDSTHAVRQDPAPARHHFVDGRHLLPATHLRALRGRTAAGEDVRRLKVMARRLYHFTSMMAVFALSSGLWLWLGFGFQRRLDPRQAGRGPAADRLSHLHARLHEAHAA